jgi:hypothetical protein
VTRPVIPLTGQTSITDLQRIATGRTGGTTLRVRRIARRALVHRLDTLFNPTTDRRI